MVTRKTHPQQALLVTASSAFLALATISSSPRLSVSAPTHDAGESMPGGLLTQTATQVAQVPVRPKAAYSAQPSQVSAGPRLIKGQVRFDTIEPSFKGASLVIELFKQTGPAEDAGGEKVAEIRFFNISRPQPGRNIFLPFTFGDFYPRPGARYSLQSFLDINANGVRDAGDFWNQRRINVLADEDPEVVRLEDFALLEGLR